MSLFLLYWTLNEILLLVRIKLRTRIRGNFCWFTNHSFTRVSTSPAFVRGKKRHSRYLSAKLACGSLSGPIQAQRERGRKLEGERGARWHASLHRHWPPSAEPAASPPPRRLSPSEHLLPPSNPPCAAPLGCNCPLGSARGGWACWRACAFVCVCVCVHASVCVQACVPGRRESWSHACLPYSAFSLFFLPPPPLKWPSTTKCCFKVCWPM